MMLTSYVVTPKHTNAVSNHADIANTQTHKITQTHAENGRDNDFSSQQIPAIGALHFGDICK